MAVVEYKEQNNVQSGDIFVCRLLTDQNITMFYRCIYFDINDYENDKLLIYNFENHYPKDNIFIQCGNSYAKKEQVMKEIKKKWTCETEIEFISNDNLLITIGKKS